MDVKSNFHFCRKYRVRDVFLHPDFDFAPMDDFLEIGPAQANYDYEWFIEEHRNPSLNDIALLKLSQ